MENDLTSQTVAAHIANRLRIGAKRHWEVMAGPGSGKTTCLISLLVRLVQSGEKPEDILMLSFGKGTVFNFSERVAKRIQVGDLDPDIITRLQLIKPRTFHSFARTVLPAKYAAIATGDALIDCMATAIRTVRDRLLRVKSSAGVTPELIECLDGLLEGNRAGLELLLRAFDYARAVAAPVDPEFEGLEALKPVKSLLPQMLKAYEASLARSGLSDFSKLLRDAVKNGRMPAKKWVLVDEYQDCTASQRAILAELVVQGTSLVAVGDVNQSVYGFAGAYPARLRTFLPQVGFTRMLETKRFTSEIAALANAVAGLKGSARIVAERSGQRPVLIESSSHTNGLKAIAMHVQSLLNDGVAPGQIAILGRTRMVIKECEDHLLRNHQIRCRRNGMGSHLDAVETVLRFVHRVRVLAESNLSVRLDDVRRCWRLKAKAKPDAGILTRALPNLKSAISRARRPCDGGLDHLYGTCADAFFCALRALEMESDKFKEVRNEVNKWAPLAAKFTSAQTMFKAVRNRRGDSISVTTTTMHMAKGMEWEHVLVVGATDGLMPIYMVKDSDFPELRQERNALYVAITRAQETVTLFHSPSPHPRTRQTFEKRCRFLVGDAVEKALDVR